CASGKGSLDEHEPRWAWRRRPTRCGERNVTGLDSLVKVVSTPVEDQRLVRGSDPSLDDTGRWVWIAAGAEPTCRRARQSQGNHRGWPRVSCSPVPASLGSD